ncbi:MAG: response regulator transcription factor [Ignavibacteriales bacterium]|nr:response regulator transcription factor [Ignavibacteriales bacterium]
MINLLIADDHPLIREGLKKTLQDEIGIHVVCEASNGQEILDRVQQYDVHVVVMDFSMPGLNGIDVIKELKKQKPKLPILVLSMHPEERYGIRLIRAGAAGYLTKESAPENLVNAIRKVAGGGRYITPKLAEQLAIQVESSGQKLPHELLSDREFQVFHLIAAGSTISEIAEKLFLSVNTVSTYRSRIMEKLNLRTNADLISYARSHFLIE